MELIELDDLCLLRLIFPSNDFDFNDWLVVVIENDDFCLLKLLLFPSEDFKDSERFLVFIYLSDIFALVEMGCWTSSLSAIN